MKLKNIFMCVAAITVLIGCSDDKEPILDKPVELAPTTMSIRIDADGTIVSKADADATISNMYVLIFKNEKLVTAEPIKSEDTIDEDTAENVDIKVSEGAHKVLVLANIQQDPITFFTEDKELSVLQAELNKLENEADGALTMSSEVMSVKFMPAVRNKIGYSEIKNGEYNAYSSLTSPVKLYRSVARIQLTQLALSSDVADDQYATPISFKLTKIFVANAKGVSHMASEYFEKEASNYLAIGAANNITLPEGANLWYYGSAEKISDELTDDKLKTVQNTVLAEKLATASDWGGVTIPVDVPHPAKADAKNPIGKSFYVYENEGQDIGTQTLLILRGDYTYKHTEPLFTEAQGNKFVKDLENGLKEYTVANRYYAIPVNTGGKIIYDNNTHRKDNAYTGVIRNTEYSLIITLTGPGSDYPYIPDAHLYYNAKVQAAPWNEPIEVGGGINN